MVIALFFQFVQLISNSDKLRTIVPYTTYCLSVRPDEGTLCTKGFVIVSSDLTKYIAALYKHEFSPVLWILQKPIVSVKDTARLLHLISCGQGTLSWAGSRMGSAAQLIELYPFFSPINTILKYGLNCYWEFTLQYQGEEKLCSLHLWTCIYFFFGKWIKQTSI